MLSKPSDPWTQLDLAGWPCWCYEPPKPDPNGTVVVYLHSSRGERMSEWPGGIEAITRHGLRALCPMTGPSWWGTRSLPRFEERPSPECLVVEHVVDHATQQWGIVPPQLALLGIGMGGQGALGIAYRNPSIFPVVAAISPTVDFHERLADGDPVLRQLYRDSEQARQETALLHIQPLNWPRHQWFCCEPMDHNRYNGVDRLRNKLASIGVPFEYDLETKASMDGEPYVDTMIGTAIAFLAEKLGRER